jgi:hypothetical protein
LVRALFLHPGLRIRFFEPPQLSLGAAKKWFCRESSPGNQHGSPGRANVLNVTVNTQFALGQSIDTSTWSNYSSALNSYLEFVKIHNFPVEPTADNHILPSSCVFTSNRTQSTLTCPEFVNSSNHGVTDVRKTRKSTLVKRTLKGCMRIRAVPTFRKNALTMNNLVTVIDYYSKTTFHDDLLLVAILVAYWVSFKADARRFWTATSNQFPVFF